MHKDIPLNIIMNSAFFLYLTLLSSPLLNSIFIFIMISYITIKQCLYILLSPNHFVNHFSITLDNFNDFG